MTRFRLRQRSFLVDPVCMGLLHRSHNTLHEPTDLRAEFAAGWDRLEIHAQGIYDTSSSKLLATEALPRWRRNPNELWAAGMILPIAEEIGLIEHCTQWATELSISAWANSTQRQHGGRFALSLHGTQLARPSVSTEIQSHLANCGVAATELMLEISDRLGSEGCRTAVDRLGPLVDAGAILALDDHRGSASDTNPNPGWLPIGSIVKLDPALTMAADDSTGRDLLEMTADELHAQGYQLVAGALERETQLAAVMHCHIGFAQGFLFAKPTLLR
jgi:EAL domain-containing protein (putative c-di-GMP-specific phosphodiesterase class I)